MWENEESRIREVYAKRGSTGKGGLYHWSRPDVLLNQYRLRSAAAILFTANGLYDLSRIKALDVGCGSGGWIRTLIQWGARAENLCGVDLLQDRIDEAIRLTPGVDFRAASGFSIPYDGGNFDIVCAHTLFSSIPDAVARDAIAGEMARVLKSGGAVFIYDYRISHPQNPDTVGIGANEVARLFPGFSVISKSMTLAPPIARPLARVSPLLALATEMVFPFLRTHAVHLLKKRA